MFLSKKQCLILVGIVLDVTIMAIIITLRVTLDSYNKEIKEISDSFADLDQSRNSDFSEKEDVVCVIVVIKNNPHSTHEKDHDRARSSLCGNNWKSAKTEEKEKKEKMFPQYKVFIFQPLEMVATKK